MPDVLTAATQPPAPEAPEAASARRAPQGHLGHGRRLAMAIDALEAFPALAESRTRLLAVLDGAATSRSDVVSTVESDVALAIAVLRLAGQSDGPRRVRAETVVEAVDVVGHDALRALADRMRTFDFFQRSTAWDVLPERFRLHAVATQRAALRVARVIDHPERDRLMVSALLHDLGKLVLARAYPGYTDRLSPHARTPEESIQCERLELGVDHAMVGGVLARRWGLPRSLASVIEGHHGEDAEGEAAIVRLADMLVHHAQGRPVSPAELERVGRRVGLSGADLRGLIYELPSAGADGVPRRVDACPLSARELDVLKQLALGKVYKQIAQDLGLSTSTVRTHLHNVYGKLGAADRAQAVLTATQRGWL